MVDSGIILVQYWLEVSSEEQTRRLESRIEDGHKIWKLTAMDLKSYSHWYDYSRARDAMFAATDTLVCGPLRRQEARSAEHHPPPVEPDSVRGAAARKGDAAQAAEGRGLSRARLPVQDHPRSLLRSCRPVSALIRTKIRIERVADMLPLSTQSARSGRSLFGRGGPVYARCGRSRLFPRTTFYDPELSVAVRLGLAASRSGAVSTGITLRLLASPIASI